MVKLSLRQRVSSWIHRNKERSDATRESKNGQLTQKEGLDYTVPAYLDKEAVYNILGTLTGGFSEVTEITTRSASADRDISSKGGEFGVSAEFVKLGIGASKQREFKVEKETEERLEKYQTTETLFNTLRNELKEQGLLKMAVDYDGSSGNLVLQDVLHELKPFEFVELQGLLRPSEIVEALPCLLTAMGFAQQNRQFLSAAENEKASEEQNEKPSDGEGETGASRIFLVDFKPFESHESVELPESKSQDRVDYTGAVLPLYAKYARDPTMAELCHRTFRVLGKVVRKGSAIEHDRPLVRDTMFDTCVNLLVTRILRQRGSGSNFEKAEELPGLLNEVADLQRNFFNSEKYKGLRIEPPAFEILPIAIYV